MKDRVLGFLTRWPKLHRVGVFVADLLDESRDDRVTGLAAEVAFWWILSLFPALLVLAAVLGSLDAVVGADLAAEVEAEVVAFVRELFGESDNAVAAAEGVFDSRPTGLLTGAAVLALWSTSRSVLALIQALQIVYDLDEHRGYVRLRLLAVGLGLATIVVSAVTLALLAVGPLLGRGERVAESLGFGTWFGPLWDLLRVPFAAAVIVAWMATIFHMAPSRRTAWRGDLPGAAVAGALWLLATAGFGLYLRMAADANFVVGVLGGALTLLLWFWLLALGLLVGGQVNAILGERHGTRSVRRESSLTFAWAQVRYRRLRGDTGDG